MKKITFLLTLALLIAFATPCFAVDTDAYNDFIRVVRDGVMYKDQISPSMSFDTDADNINTIIKNNVTTGTYTGDNTVGVVLKGYVQSGVSVAGNSEINGASVFLLNDATQAGGSKSSILSCHVHSDSSTTVDRGISVFGAPTSVFYISGGATNLIETPDALSAGYGSGSLKNSDASDIKCDAYLTVKIGDTTYYLPLYDTLN